VCCSHSFAQSRKPVVVPGKSVLPLRVLARPFSNIYDKPDGTIITENVPVFQSYIVYTRPDVSITSTVTEGWYEIGSDVRGTVLGWMKAEDVMEWKQTMCLAYTHPGGRQPVLMFERLEPLRGLLNMPPDSRAAAADDLYQSIAAGDMGENFPIIAKEPDDFVDIIEQFYLLPILEHTPVEIDYNEGRLLKVAAATKTERGSVALETSTAGLDKPEAEVLPQVQMDIVYVVDMTGSMQPYIDATLEVIKNMALSITKDDRLAASVKFGLWGYRDTLPDNPEMPDVEFLTKNFTPEFQDVNDFAATLATVQADGGGDGPEDVYSGVEHALRQSAWTPEGLHILVLIGDAPSHQLGEARNASGHSAKTLRNFADPPNNVYIYAVHIKDHRAPQDYWDLTQAQFQTLAFNPGLELPSYWNVMSNDKAGFMQASREIAGDFVSLVKLAKQGDMASIKAKIEAAPQDSPLRMGHAALVQWLGREKGVKAPRDVTAWITDKDLLDPDIQAMDVRILVSKNELDSLKTVLQEIMTAGRRGLIGGEEFFTALQSIPSVVARAGEQIKHAQNIAESGLLPEFMLDLPYRSRIMNMSNELWASWGVDQQEEFLTEIDAIIKLYAAIHESPQGWIALNEGDDPGDYVHPISLGALP